MSYIIYKGEKYYVKDGILDLRNKGIKDILEIKGLENLTNLQELDLRGNQITEIKGLENLKDLQRLNLGHNQITEIKGLKTLIYLQELSLDHNQITEIKGLRTLIYLQELTLDHNQITEIKGLETLTNSQWLRLDNNQIDEIKGLKTLINLKTLFLDHNKIDEIKGLGYITNLRWLRLDNNQITEIKGLEYITNLRWLILSFNQIDEIKGLEKLINLKALALNNNPINSEEIYLINKRPQEVVKYCNEIKKSFEFDFAFSFAGEDREIVEKVYNSLTKRGFKVFYDKPFEWYLAGKDLDKSFKEIYGKKSKYVVAFISKHYSEKKWTDFERQIAEKAAESRKEEYIIPIRLDNSITYGIKSTIGYINYQKKGTRGVADILEKKLKDFNKRHNIR